MKRRKLVLTLVVALLGLAFSLTATTASSAEPTPGVSSRLITIGGTFPFSGPASLYAGIGTGQAAYFSYVNDHGGVNGRQIKFITLDDGYNPANTVQLTHRLVEQDEVFQPNYIAEGYIYGKFIVDKVPQAKIGVLYQNDAYGQDYLTGLKKGLGKQQGKIVETEGYEVTASDVASQVANLKASGANVLFVAATPTFAIQSVVLARKLGWHPTIFMNSVSATNKLMGLAAKNAGAEAVDGIISVQ